VELTELKYTMLIFIDINLLVLKQNYVAEASSQPHKFWRWTRFYTLAHCTRLGHAVAQWVDTISYKPEGHGFNSRQGIGSF
jgi:hypothetical protein